MPGPRIPSLGAFCHFRRVQHVINQRAHLAGPLTMEAFRPLIPHHVKKSKDVTRIMAEANRMAAEEILKRSNGQMMAKKGKIQTFGNDERGLLVACMQHAIGATCGNGAANLDGWIRAPRAGI